MKLKTPLMKAPAGRMFYPGNTKAVFWGIGTTLLVIVIAIVIVVSTHDDEQA